MDDEDTAFAQFLDHFVHARSHFRDPGGGAFAPVLIPHVADDCGAAGRLPTDMVGHLFPLVHTCVQFAEPAQIQFQRAWLQSGGDAEQGVGDHAKKDQGALEAGNFHTKIDLSLEDEPGLSSYYRRGDLE